MCAACVINFIYIILALKDGFKNLQLIFFDLGFIIAFIDIWGYGKLTVLITNYCLM